MPVRKSTPSTHCAAACSLCSKNESQDTTTTVFPVDGAGNPTGPAFPITANNSNYGVFGGLYLQDEWKITDQLTANYGGRFDFFNSSFDHENQFSPRANLIYKPTDWTTLHAGYARYFTPPPVENTSVATVNQFDGTFKRLIHHQRDQRDPVRAR